jgi:hypothetical protein
MIESDQTYYIVEGKKKNKLGSNPHPAKVSSVNALKGGFEVRGGASFFGGSTFLG